MQRREDSDKIHYDPHICEEQMSRAEVCNLKYVGLVTTEGLGKGLSANTTT